MKQILFLLLFPCFALAQYPNNGGQKITLGEQTTADGLIWRGVANDTNVITPFSDTSAYIILDTVNSKFYHYNRTSTYWALAGGGGGGGGGVESFSAGTTGLSPSDATTGAVTLGGTLAVENGGTGQSTLTENKVMVGNGTSGVLTPTDLHWDNLNTLLGVGETSLSTFKLTVKGAFPILFNTTSNANTLTYGGTRFFRNTSTLNNGNGFQYSFNDANGNAAEYGYFGGYIIDNTVGSTDGGFIFAPTLNNVRTQAVRILNDGEMWIGYTSDNGAYKLQVNGQIFATNATIATSDEKFKENITPLSKGLEIVNKLKPVTFNFISNTENNFSEYEEVGFIAQDVDRALSTETFAKSIVKSADDSEPTSTMGLATQNLIPILVKAIQEQNALIKALEQRLLILENK
mgnify:CR=1 FL=1